MPKMPREEVAERANFVLETWKRIWPKDMNTVLGKEHTAKHVDQLVFEKYGEHMNTMKIYALRERAIEDLRAAGLTVPEPPRKHFDGVRPAAQHTSRGVGQPILSAGRNLGEAAVTGLPVMITGLMPGAVAGVSKVLDRLREMGTVNLSVVHAGDTYVVINTGQ